MLFVLSNGLIVLLCCCYCCFVACRLVEAENGYRTYESVRDILFILSSPFTSDVVRDYPETTGVLLLAYVAAEGTCGVTKLLLLVLMMGSVFVCIFGDKTSCIRGRTRAAPGMCALARLLRVLRDRVDEAMLCCW